MNTLQFIEDAGRFVFSHWGAITGWLVAAYHVIANAGGCRKIWSNFMGPSLDSAPSVNAKTTPADGPCGSPPAQSKDTK